MDELNIPGLNPITDDYIHHQIKNLIIQLLEKCTQEDLCSSTFVGASPVPLFRRDFNFLKRKEYWVCESSQGLRVLLYFYNEKVYFYDETGKICFFESSEFFIPSSTNSKIPQNNTLLECEIPYNYHYNKHCAMIIDAVYVDGDPLFSLPLSKRLEAIRNKIIFPLRQYYTDEEEIKLPISILGKDFMRLSHLNRVLEKIKHYTYSKEEEASGHRYMYENGKRYNDSDGLMFIPEDKPYKPLKCISIKRWKHPVFNTVNFLVRVLGSKPKPSFKFYILGSGGEKNLTEYRTIFFSPECTSRLMNKLGNETEAIIECYYDSQSTGEWVFYQVTDKKVPDTYTSVFATLEIGAEIINKEDLVKNFCVKKTSKPNTIERPHTTPHKTNVYPNSDERSPGVEGSSQNDKEVVYESPKSTLIRTSPDVLNNKRKLDALSEDEDFEGSPTVKKPRLYE